MKVVVKVFAVLRNELGWREKIVELDEGSSIKDLLDRLPEIKKLVIVGDELHENYRIFVNGRFIGFLDGLDSKLSEGDVVAIFPAMAGGSLCLCINFWLWII